MIVNVPAAVFGMACVIAAGPSADIVAARRITTRDDLMAPFAEQDNLHT